MSGLISIYPMEADMRLTQVNRASSLIKEVLTGEDHDESMVYLSVMAPPTHKQLIKELAKINRVKQAPVLRAIIEEWCESKDAVASVNGEVA